MQLRKLILPVLALVLLLALVPDEAEARFGGLGRGINKLGRGLGKGIKKVGKGVGKGIKKVAKNKQLRRVVRELGQDLLDNVVREIGVGVPNDVGESEILDLLQYTYCQLQPLERGASALRSDLERRPDRFDRQVLGLAEQVADAYGGAVGALEDMSDNVSASRCSDGRFHRGAAPRAEFGLGSEAKAALEAAARTNIVTSAANQSEAKDALAAYSKAYNSLSKVLAAVQSLVDEEDGEYGSDEL